MDSSENGRMNQEGVKDGRSGGRPLPRSEAKQAKKKGLFVVIEE